MNNSLTYKTFLCPSEKARKQYGMLMIRHTPLLEENQDNVSLVVQTILNVNSKILTCDSKIFWDKRSIALNSLALKIVSLGLNRFLVHIDRKKIEPPPNRRQIP